MRTAVVCRMCNRREQLTDYSAAGAPRGTEQNGSPGTERFWRAGGRWREIQRVASGRRIAEPDAMRKTILALVLLWSTPALAQKGGGDFGIGLQVGGPTGLNAKYYMGNVALQFGVGIIETGWDDGLHVFADLVFHPVILAQTRDFTLPLYVGGGVRVFE